MWGNQGMSKKLPGFSHLLQQDIIPIIELFGPVIQGEGAVCGQVSYFIRTGGCSFRCEWCDSMHAVEPKQITKNARWMTSDRIVDEIRRLAPNTRKSSWVTLTGGDPLLWDMTRVVAALKLNGFRVAVETQGFLWHDWLESCDLVTASPKGPSSGMLDKFRFSVLQKYDVRLGERFVLKVVCFTDDDLAWASKLHLKLPRIRFFLSSGTPQDDASPDNILGAYRALSEDVLKNHPLLHDATILPQVHALMYGKELGR